MHRTSRFLLAICIPVTVLVAGFMASNPGSKGDVLAPVRPRDVTSYRDVVARVLPAVVSIEAKAKPKKPEAKRRRPENIEQLPKEVRDLFDELEQNKQESGEDANLGFGSGWIVDSKGVILTNYHVVEGAESLEVTLVDGRKFTTRDVLLDKKTDLAVVRVQATEDLPTLEFSDSNQMELGDRVLAFGSPFGLTGSVTSGIISAKGRNLRLNMYEDFLQTDAAINPGNSGGPLVNLDGKVIGITSAIKSKSGGFQGVGLAISSNMAKSVLVQLLRDGVVRRGYLGVQIDELPVTMAARIGLRESGVIVRRVMPNSPSSKAGLKPGDVILAVAGRPVRNGKELQDVVAGLPLNEATNITIFRDGRLGKYGLTIIEQPDTVN